MTATSEEQELQALREMIRATGLRSTSARLEVLKRLRDSANAMSHAELADELVPRGFDQATVYRNLTDLTEVGLLSRIDLGDHVWRFEYHAPHASHEREHPHFVCTDCGGVSCLEGVSVNVAGDSGRSIREISQILLRGRCEECVLAEPAPSP